VELYKNRKVEGFDSDLRESAFRFNTKSLHFLCLIVSENVSDLMEKRYPIYTYPWVPYDQNTTVHLVRFFLTRVLFIFNCLYL
jgi:hypothetical protein